MGRAIAIDGPAGAGKSTIAKVLAKELGFTYIDTGAMYRTLALFVDESGIDALDEEAVVEACKKAEIGVAHDGTGQRMLLNGRDVTDNIRTEKISSMASGVSAYEKVRAFMVSKQQRLAERTDVIMDGRDIGTVVLPEADLKIYLTAEANERAKRRMKEYEKRGEKADFNEILEDIKTRDRNDMTREHSPLKKADDAVTVDTTFMDIDEVADKIKELFSGLNG